MFPKKINLIKNNGNVKDIQLNHFKIGDRYASVFSSALKNCKEFS